MRFEVGCPCCGLQIMTSEDIASMIAVRKDLALTSFICPRCGSRLAVMTGMPSCLNRVPAGPSRETIQVYLDYFHHELEDVESVDDAIAEIDGYLPHGD